MLAEQARGAGTQGVNIRNPLTEMRRRSVKYRAAPVQSPELVVSPGCAGSRRLRMCSCNCKAGPARGAAAERLVSGAPQTPAGSVRNVPDERTGRRHRVGWTLEARALGTAKIFVELRDHDMGREQPGHVYSRRRLCRTQAKTTGSRQALSHAPPSWAWMGVPSPARHSGRQRAIQPLSHRDAWAAGAAHGFLRPGGASPGWSTRDCRVPFGQSGQTQCGCLGLAEPCRGGEGRPLPLGEVYEQRERQGFFVGARRETCARTRWTAGRAR